MLQRSLLAVWLEIDWFAVLGPVDVNIIKPITHHKALVGVLIRESLVCSINYMLRSMSLPLNFGYWKRIVLNIRPFVQSPGIYLFLWHLCLSIAMNYPYLTDSPDLFTFKQRVLNNLHLLSKISCLTVFFFTMQILE